jgi:antitoxin component YwqK of YwqJK toxin-antitoxin module
MAITRSLLLLFLPLLLWSCSTKKYVASSHPNGKQEVVIYMKGKGEEAEKVMEKVYYANGQLEYVGRFANGVEHGTWEYFYENGTRKYTEHWENGVEHGIQLDYSPDGQVYRELHYDKGRLVREVDRSKE